MNNMTARGIIEVLKSYAKESIPVPREKWLDGGFNLESLRLEEAEKYNLLRQEVSKKKLEILKAQEKKNVALADAEIESLDIYRELRNQEDLIHTIDEIVRLAKKSSDINY